MPSSRPTRSSRLVESHAFFRDLTEFNKRPLRLSRAGTFAARPDCYGDIGRRSGRHRNSAMRRTALLAGILRRLACGHPFGRRSVRPGQPPHLPDGIQPQRRAPLRLNVRPRKWLELGPTVAPYSSVNPARGRSDRLLPAEPAVAEHARTASARGTLPVPVDERPLRRRPQPPRPGRSLRRASVVGKRRRAPPPAFLHKSVPRRIIEAIVK